MNTPLFEIVSRIVSDVFEIPEDQVKADSSPDNVANWDSIHQERSSFL